ncbi:MAG TPA: carbamoyltransferase C-terminal domain-containing protein [Acidimicrobiales bacterium]|nr:carbamoyltransferase C-terminal domain-containing protein [Acidimicrobiales bacterium]
MTTTPSVVGLNRTQDGSVAVAVGDSDVYSLQKERVTRRKHHWGRLGDLPNLYHPRLPQLRQPVDLVVECYSSDSEFAKLDSYQEELLGTLRFRGQPELVRISHHLSHLYSAFFPSPFERAAVMVVDAQGSYARDFTEPFPGRAAVAPDLLEVASFYRCDRGRVECLGKQLWDGDWNRPAGLGCFYYKLTRMIFPEGEGAEGKVMGLAPFGRVGSLGLPELVVDENRVLIPDEWLKLFEERDRFLYSPAPGAFEAAADLAAEGQHAFETAVLKLADWLHEQTGEDNLCFVGGTALNCSANGRIIREGPFREVFIPPSPHDGGTALGCALYGLIECLGVESRFRWVNDFLGPELDPADVEAAVAELPPGLQAEKPEDLVGRVADLLDSGRVVAVCEGRSESGPRALGHRSIIADARNPAVQDFINAKVKGREWFRPLAPLVLAEDAPRIFDVARPAPFMQYAADVRPEHRAALPAITHVDGSARLQTVEPANTPFLHAILAGFAERTGCPVLLNTSLNEKGDPLVETPEEAVRCLASTWMHALVMPPYLVTKVDEPPLPGTVRVDPRGADA